MTQMTIDTNQVQANSWNQVSDFPISARDIHAKLQSGQQFTTWIKSRVDQYSFQEGSDFLTTLEESTGGRRPTEYMLSVDMAKELCILENNEIGKLLRRELIKQYSQRPRTIDEIMVWSAQQLHLQAKSQRELESRQFKLEVQTNTLALEVTQEAIDAKVKKSLKHAIVNVFPNHCLKLETIVERHYFGMNHAKISQWLNIINHPTEEYRYQSEGSEIITKRVWHTEGLDESFQRLMQESQKIEPKSSGEKKNVQFVHPIIGRFYISKSRILK